MPPALLKFPEGIHEARVHKGGKAWAFLGRETVVVKIGARIGEVNFRVSHIKVAAKNYRLLFFETFQLSEKVMVPFLTIGEPGQIALGIGHVDVYEKEIVELRRLHAAFAI